MSEPTQSFDRHAKLVSGYHKWATALLVLPTLYFLFLAVSNFSVERLVVALFAIGVIIAALYARLFPLGVQDRVIRLEERLRMEQLLPGDLKGRIPEVTTDALIGLRFASDEELPELVRRVLDGELSNRTDIKKAIKHWRADHQRI